MLCTSMYCHNKHIRTGKGRCFTPGKLGGLFMSDNQGDDDQKYPNKGAHHLKAAAPAAA